MQVQFNPAISTYKTPAFSAKQENIKETTPLTKDKIITAKTKRAVSECSVIVIGLSILYFGMKKNLKLNKIKKMEEKLAKLAKQEVLVPELIKVV